MKKVLCIILFHAFCAFLAQAQHYVFYGMTSSGGKNNEGVIYRFDPLSGKYDTLYSLSYATGSYTWAGLTLANNGLLYGMTEEGGTKNYGVMFSFNPANNNYNVLINFDSVHTGAYQVNGNNLMQAKSGLLYGTREWGGTNDSGVFFSYNITTGKDSVLINFNTRIGALPNLTVVEDTTTGYLFGTTLYGGANDMGVIFRYDPLTNKDTVVFNFDTIGANAAWPKGNTFIKASNGLYYGMTAYGGYNGAIYSFNPITFKDTTLVRLTSNSGCGPTFSNLMQAQDGLLYGVTSTGGAYVDGVLFSFDITNNKKSVLVNLDGTNGSEPTGNLIQDPDNGLLYGIAEVGGTNNMGVIFCYNPITGKDSVVINFNGTNGAYPVREPTLVKDTLTSIKEISTVNTEVKIYPDPNNGKFTVQLAGKYGEDVIEIYNVLGEQVYSAGINSATTQIDLSARPSGIYLYRVITKMGGLLNTGKISIE